MALGPSAWASVRTWLTRLLTEEPQRDVVEPHLRPLDEVTLHLPFAVADYVDFYCSLQHATNVGRIFRPEGEPLLPNWRHLPVGLPRTRRHGGGLGYADPAATGPGPAELGRRPARLRPEPSAGHRGRARLRGRRTDPARRAGPDERVRRPRVRGDPGQRLVRQGHPGLGVRPAGAVPGQVVRDLGLGLGHPARRAGGGAGRPSPARTPRRWSTCGSTSPPATTSTSRCCSTARWSAGRRTPRCTGRRHRCSRT